MARRRSSSLATTRGNGASPAIPPSSGRTILVGAAPHTVVGVMPRGFAFPLDHQFWTALRWNPSAHQRLEGPGRFVFGRLSPGVSLEAAQAELSTIGQRAAAAAP